MKSSPTGPDLVLLLNFLLFPVANTFEVQSLTTNLLGFEPSGFPSQAWDPRAN